MNINLTNEADRLTNMILIIIPQKLQQMLIAPQIRANNGDCNCKGPHALVDFW